MYHYKLVEPVVRSAALTLFLSQRPGRRGFGDLASERRQSGRHLRLRVSRRPERRHRRRPGIGQTVRLPVHREVCESPIVFI